MQICANDDLLVSYLFDRVFIAMSKLWSETGIEANIWWHKLLQMLSITATSNFLEENCCRWLLLWTNQRTKSNTYNYPKLLAGWTLVTWCWLSSSASERVDVDGVDVSTAVEGSSKRLVKRLIASMFCVNLSSTSSDSRLSLSSASASVKFCWSYWFKVTRKFYFRVRSVANWFSLLMYASERLSWSFDIFSASLLNLRCLPLFVSFSFVFLWTLLCW